MAWKGVHISQPARLSLKDNQILVVQDTGEVCLALEDVAWVVLDTNQVSLTGTLLSAIADAGIVLVCTDSRHTPNGMMLPFHSHHRQAGVAAAQIETTAPFRKRCWQAIVVAKIENQAAHLRDCGREFSGLQAMAQRVGSGDQENMEARAARAYWGLLFRDFIRANEDDIRNKMLNYGYAVVRAAVARAVVIHGLLPAIGLHHVSITNAFNLADDLVEPFRPFVDALVNQLSEGRDVQSSLQRSDRQALAGILMHHCRVGSERMTVLAATERVAQSLVRSIEGASPALLVLPVFQRGAKGQ
ncbi:MAG: type II CRISPR-associated endonuclease Cas1 [Rhodospirillaceae bacterium]